MMRPSGVSHPDKECGHVRKLFERRANLVSALAGVVVLAVLLLGDSSTWIILVPALVAFWVVIHLIFQELATVAEERQPHQPFDIWSRIDALPSEETNWGGFSSDCGTQIPANERLVVDERARLACLPPTDRGDAGHPPT